MIGQSVRNIGWEAIASGTLRSVDDRTMPGTLEASMVRSTHAHAVIKNIDISEAQQIDGVHAVLTAYDLPNMLYPHLGAKFADRSVLAKEKVRFVGEPLVLIAA